MVIPEVLSSDPCQFHRDWCPEKKRRLRQRCIGRGVQGNTKRGSCLQATEGELSPEALDLGLSASKLMNKYFVVTEVSDTCLL